MISSRASALTFSLMLATALAADALVAQARPGGGSQELSGWAPPSLGIRAGYDSKQQRNVLGAQVRIPVLPGGEVELMPNMDITFLRGAKSYQYNVEAVYILDGRAGGFYGGAGLGIRDAIFGLEPGRQTKMGVTGVIGLRLVGLGLIVPQIEYRWIFISDAPLTYQQLTVGVNLALWQPGPRAF